jgi:Flp pilus assembly protein CpaB
MNVWRRRWPRTTKIFAVLAVACGLAAFAITRGYAAQVDALRPAVGPWAPVVEAARGVSRGSVLGANDVALAAVPEAFAPSVALRTTADALGRVALVDLAAGEIVTATRVSAGGTGPLASLVPPGLRAVSVPIATPVPGLAAGDRVDVIASVGGGGSYADTVAEGLEVLRPADADTSSLGDDAGAVVMLLADPATAERLARSATFGSLSLTVIGTEPSAFPAPGQEPSGG